MILYHWSPNHNHAKILRQGLLVPKLNPKIIVPTTCSEGHLNPHISFCNTPSKAWELSGGFLYDRVRQGVLDVLPPTYWDLFEVNMIGIRYQKYGDEYQSRIDIPPSRIKTIAIRNIND